VVGGPAGAGLFVTIVVRSVLGRTACRGHQPHHDNHGGTGGRTGGRLIATIAANERKSSPVWPPSSGATTPAADFDWRFTATDFDDLTSPASTAPNKRRSRRPPDPHELTAPTTTKV